MMLQDFIWLRWRQ